MRFSFLSFGLPALLLVLLSLCACGGSYTPRPYGYFRVDLPPHSYRSFDSLGLPYRFELSEQARVVLRDAHREWIDIHYPALNGSVYCSYLPVSGNLFELSEDARRIVYKHSVRADGIRESFYENPGERVYALLYDLEGNTASPLQFVVTDSLRHFFRAALYFNHVPNKDSIAPMMDYVRADMLRLIESFQWKK